MAGGERNEESRPHSIIGVEAIKCGLTLAYLSYARSTSQLAKGGIIISSDVASGPRKLNHKMVSNRSLLGRTNLVVSCQTACANGRNYHIRKFNLADEGCCARLSHRIAAIRSIGHG